VRYPYPCASSLSEPMQGVAPTLLYPVPSHGLISKIIRSVRDYYPLWQVCMIINRDPETHSDNDPFIARLLPAPAIIQFVILLLLIFESAVGLLPKDREGGSIFLVFMLISIEGICGGLA
jgi:battenin